MNPTTSADALAAYQSAQGQAQDPNTILQGQRQQLGVDAAQQTVTGLRGAINNTTKLLAQVAPSVMGRTGSSLVTNAQASKQIQNEQAPISANLNQENTDYNQASSDANNLEQKAETAANGIYAGQQDKLSYAQNLYNTLYKQEQDAQAQANAVADLAEKKREADLAAKSSGSTFNLPGATPSPTPAPNDQKTLTGGKSINDAATSLKSLLATNNATVIRNTLKAIEESALHHGNTYDRAKLQLINSQPEFQQYLNNFNGATF